MSHYERETEIKRNLFHCQSNNSYNEMLLQSKFCLVFRLPDLARFHWTSREGVLDTKLPSKPSYFLVIFSPTKSTPSELDGELSQSNLGVAWSQCPIHFRGPWLCSTKINRWESLVEVVYYTSYNNIHGSLHLWYHLISVKYFLLLPMAISLVEIYIQNVRPGTL